MQLTPQQIAAIESSGKTIVSASAGSGKTFVMIRKLADAIERGVDLDNVLAVTFTKKAAAQMKEKLRAALIGRLDGADDKTRAALKVQLSKISSAGISTIHAFCARLLRTYFYEAGIDGSFDIISADDAEAKEYKSRALDGMFERYYAEDNENFKVLLSCYRKKRGDAYLKSLILSAYEKLRINADYISLLDGVYAVYTDKGFEKVCTELSLCARRKYAALHRAVKKFAAEFSHPRGEYAKILSEMRIALETAIESDIFADQPPLTVTRKPVDKTEEDKLAGAEFKKFKDDVAARYKAVRADISDKETERANFFESGRTAIAFCEVLREFDAEYTAVKRDENKLDYNDLEHLTLALLNNEEVRKEVNARYTYVYVDEYQDVNPVQERILSLTGGRDVFMVGDVKQAIYGFRGSRSLLFAENYERFEGGDGSALRLSSNFRSSDGVLDFVNKLFSNIMTTESCGFDYSDGSIMQRGGGYPEGFGSAEIHIFGKDEEERAEPGVYSVLEDGREVRHTREGLAVLALVEKELKSKHYDLKTGGYVDTQPGDICILTRKRNKAAAGIVRALTDAGYAVAGAQEANVLNRPEVKQMVDILSYIDNAEQDIPLVTALLSPLGGLTCDELAAVRIAAKGDRRLPFRECCEKYADRMNGGVAEKLRSFYKRAERLRELKEIFSAAEIIDAVLEQTGLEAAYAAGGGEKLKNLRRFAAEGAGMGVAAFLSKLRGGYEIAAPAAAASDSIKIMTMHASKGLEFPVVIISDICATYKGREQTELPFDEQFGFAPRCHDRENMIVRGTLLRKLAAERSGREELKNELNLFYVACTRAMCRLHVMAQEVTAYNPSDAYDASAYSKLFDMTEYSPKETEPKPEFGSARKVTLISSPDAELADKISSRFMREYARADSVNLPVKSSASAILRLGADEPVFRPHELFPSEGETGTERGTAYHRFLELCDFSVKDADGIRREIRKFCDDGRISAGQCGLLNAQELSEILGMPIFAGLDGARLFREREFLCRLPANELFDTAADDGILVQGAIDLLAETKDGYAVIDYKYSNKSDAELVATYSRQLALYKKAVALITRTAEKNISTAIVNIYRRRQIIL